MEPRIATLLDQSPYRRVTLDPSVLTGSSSVVTRPIEPALAVDEARSTRELAGQNDYLESRSKSHGTSFQAHSGAPIARVLNAPTFSSYIFQPTTGRQTPHATFRRNDDAVPGTTAASPDARKTRDDTGNSAGLSVTENSLIQLPKPPQVAKKTAKRPRIPPLLQGLHQPPPLPPKSRLFPPITSDNIGFTSDVGTHFCLGNVFVNTNTEEQAEARVSPRKRDQFKNSDAAQAIPAESTQHEPHDLSAAFENKAGNSPTVQVTSRAQSQCKAPRKRNRWSQKETEDLLLGVSRFGIGRWKQILGCADFQFQGRTAVDLKDRFRVCRPGEGLKARKVATPEQSGTTKSDGPSQSNAEPKTTTSVEKITEQDNHSTGRNPLDGMSSQGSVRQATTSAADTHGPFPKSKRRARREFSETDDQNLLKGFKRHGPVWHLMRDDFELGFGMRHPTDLRDRFRIRYPKLFAQAGYKLKPKEERILEDQANKPKTLEMQTSPHQVTTTSKTPKSSGDRVAQHKLNKLVSDTVTVSTPGVSSVTTIMPTITTSQLDPTRPTFNSIADLTFDDDDDAQSPIVLNRNILQWADENSFSLPPTIPTQVPPHSTTDTLYNPFTANDGLHINPLVTLKLQSTSHWSYTTPPTAAAPSLPPPAPLKHPLSATAPNTSVARPVPDMRTPNLPNIVFPHVPNASARNAVHNLPPPADILSSGQVGGENGWIWIG